MCAVRISSSTNSVRFSSFGKQLFFWLDTRLRQVTTVVESFGGVSLILCGDFGQIGPVADTPLYINRDYYSSHVHKYASLLHEEIKDVVF